MGSASAAALAARGARVIVFDRRQTPHTDGSTHGHTRIIREAYYEHPLYVPLVRRAYELWRSMERASGVELLRETGGLTVGREHGPLITGALASVRAHDIAHELLDAAAVAERFPAYRARPDWVAIREARAGLLFPEQCVQAFLAFAESHGAALHLGEAVTGWRRNGAGVLVETSRHTYEVDRLIVAAGPWLPGLSPLLHAPLPLEVERQLSHWFTPRGASGMHHSSRCPVALWDTDGAGDLFATLPDIGHGVKCGMHHDGVPTTPERVDRTVSAVEQDAARALLAQVMPAAAGVLRDSRVCLYTNTPDRHFIIDWDKGERVLVVSPCSGHGFKFASAIGELVAQLCLDGRPWLDLSPFSLSRFA